MNITYLLGAGASYNALPVINELPQRLGVFQAIITVLRSYLETHKNGSLPEQEMFEKVKVLELDIQWLREEITTHKTVDTLAKKFYVVLEHHDSLVRLKKVMIAYFLFEQTKNDSQLSKEIRESPKTSDGQNPLKESPDKRYDSFIATIISKVRGDLNLDSSFNVLTWNYDVQLELAFENYLPNPTLFEIRKRLQTIPNELFLNNKKEHDFERFSVVRLNGVAGLATLPMIKGLTKNTLGEVNSSDLIMLLAELHSQKNNEDVAAFSFAWEDNQQLASVHPQKIKIFESARQVLMKTNILVVVGYSFPNFNRSIDKKLLANLKNLKKVYIQDVKAQSICELVSSSFELREWKNVFSPGEGGLALKKQPTQVPVIPYTDVDQFFIPPEAEI